MTAPKLTKAQLDAVCIVLPGGVTVTSCSRGCADAEVLRLERHYGTGLTITPAGREALKGGAR